MKIAIYNTYPGQPVAETGLSRRISKAANALGWESLETGNSREINRFNPDFVLMTHFRTAKLTRHPAYGCIWSPPVFMESEERFIRNILSYDAYLSSSDSITEWLKDLLYHTHKKHFVAPFYTSCHAVPYREPNLKQPRLLYAGTNWDGPRFQGLFQRLDALPRVDIYGGENAWGYLEHSYRGLLPFDGTSILDALHRAGAGLCLHKEEHRLAGTPSLRIFEIAASGAIGICQEHPFIRAAFGDSVLYLEETPDMAARVEQISGYLAWIERNPEKALAMSKRAYDIFASRYTLDHLLSEIEARHRQLVREKAFKPEAAPHTVGQPRVQYVVRVGGRSVEKVKRALDSVASQTCPAAGAIIVQYREVPGLPGLLETYRDRLALEVIGSPNTGFRSTQLWDGLHAVSAEFFAVLDDDDALHPNHVASLLPLLDRFPHYGVAYGGAIRVWEPEDSQAPATTGDAETSELYYSEPFDPNRLASLENFVQTNSFVARSSLIGTLGRDPQLKVAEDLFLLLSLSLQTDFIFSYEATCEFYWREGKQDNSIFDSALEWATSYDRVRRMFWKRQAVLRYPIGARYNLKAELERLREVEAERQRLQDIIAHMERSKFWKMRQIWHRLKNAVRPQP